LTPPAFLRWIAGMAPLALAVCLATWLVLTRWVVRVPAALPRLDAGFRQASRLGPWTAPEIRVGLVFLAAVILWITRTLPIERQELGWIGLFPADFFGATPPEDAITSSTVAIAMAFVAFVVPAGDGRGSRLADGEAIRAVPWDMLLLLGGGFAIAKAFTVSKLSDVLGRELAPVLGNGALGAWPIVLGLSAFVTFLSEVTSNTATALVMLPIAANLGRAAGVDPRIPMLTVTLASSLAFMLPIGTPPNAIVFASRRIPMPVMVGGGFVLNLAAILLSSAAVIWWVCPILGIPT
jgi:sodium-dependent dicarboxylate transporter 2/3/5